MFGCDTTGSHNGQMLAPKCGTTEAVMAAHADGYTCVYSQLKSMSSVAIRDVIF